MNSAQLTHTFEEPIDVFSHRLVQGSLRFNILLTVSPRVVSSVTNSTNNAATSMFPDISDDASNFKFLFSDFCLFLSLSQRSQ